MRSVFLSILAALTLITSVGLGHARGAMPAEDGFVICRGHVTTIVWIDASGAEVEAEVLCPDAALSLLTHAAMDAPSLRWRTAESLALFAPAANHTAPAVARVTPKVRGPPVSF
ncbi:MAG: hypothetical protein AAFR53_10820 [Pseudomonadota bacterium]